jgi:tRNA(fMet)-specific endonuclease VapC
LRKPGIPIGDFDLFIGCTALAKDMIVVTENIKEYKRISNIKLDNWVER